MTYEHRSFSPAVNSDLDHSRHAGQCSRPAYREDVTLSHEKSEISEMNFEQALSALEEIVQQLESGSVPLDKSIALYEKGEALRQLCQARLDSAQERIEQIVADKSGQASGTQTFDSGS